MNPILPGAPWLIAHRSMLGVNKPNKITLNGRDYVLWQNRKGEVFALDNICPHMQAPLSAGWVCQQRDTITCPFHALEFDGQGRLYKKGKLDTKPITQPLQLVVASDCIWTYAGFQPRLPIPDLIQKISAEYDFIGTAGEKSIQGDFLSNLLVNYDYNHQTGTHREIFRIKSNHIPSFEKNGYYPKVVQEITRDNNSLGEIIKNPVLLILPKAYSSKLEYAFPSTTVFFANAGVGKIAQVHIIYPESENKTKTFVITFTKFNQRVFNFLLRKSVLKAVTTVVEQDTTAVENLYPRQQPKIRLPNEEIMFYAEKLYREW